MNTLPNFGLQLIFKALFAGSQHAIAVEPELPALDFAQLRNLPRDPNKMNARGSHWQPSKAPGAFPPPVPFNYPNS
ncbi:MAG TPA: hypothetical protein VGD78_11290 [Chthoniobacterales bacterium]